VCVVRTSVSRCECEGVRHEQQKWVAARGVDAAALGGEGRRGGEERGRSSLGALRRRAIARWVDDWTGTTQWGLLGMTSSDDVEGCGLREFLSGNH
jgi:hypothetical protein